MAQLESKLLSYVPAGSSSPLSDTIGLFLDTVNEPKWNDMYAAVKAFIAAQSSSLYPGLRVVVTLSDGQVALDTSKDTTIVGGVPVPTVGNTFLKFQGKTINENHNSRLSILTALLSNAGTGYEHKWSSSEQKFEIYHAQRMGSTPSHPLGVVRVSVYDH
jgi:hypothetical protein